MGKQKAKRLKTINVKGTTVNTDHGAFLRKSYVKQAEVNVDDGAKNKLESKEIESMKDLSQAEGGISGSVKKITFKDGSHGYFKPSKGEPFVRKISSP